MASIRTAVELDDRFSGVLNNIVNTVNMSVSAMEQMQTAMNLPVDNSAFDGMRNYANQATIAVQELNAALQGSESYEMPALNWQSDTIDVFTNSGVERFKQEAQSANDLLHKLGDTQNTIAANSQQTSLFPPQMTADLTNMHSRITAISQQIQLIESNPLNMGTDIANSELEQLRGQLDQAVREQEMLNQAVENMDVQAANQAYLRLSQTVGNTERYIRDNVEKQGRFNRAIQDGTDYAGQLKGMIAGAVSAFAGMAGVKKAFSFIQNCTQAFDTQLNSEVQLISVLANTIGNGFESQVELEAAVDTSLMTEQIEATVNNVSEAAVTVTAKTEAVTAAFNDIKDKAAEIQSRGIYGDEAMIAAGAEFATYFTDTGAIEMMMDTLSDYAMGMSGGGTVDSSAMVEYATNLGKIMTGSYDAMTKKGFKFTDSQKAIIEGTATQEQIVSALGEEYVDTSSDMQAAAAISQVIEESWEGIYENMSNTPAGQIQQMTNAWGDMLEVIGGQLYPYVLLFVNAVRDNWSTIEDVIQGITVGLEFLLGILSWVLEGTIAFSDAVIENWSWISPIIYGIAAALAVYYGWQLAINTVNAVGKGIHMLTAAAQMVHAAATGTLTAATAADIAAQNGLNAALYACPIVWIIVLIIALIAIIYAVVAAINHFTGSSLSATAIICGSFMAILATIGNVLIAAWNLVIDIFSSIYNFIADIANAIGTLFNDPLAGVVRIFTSVADFILSVLQALASAIDAIFGTSLADGVQGWRDGMNGWVDDTFGEAEKVMEKMDADSLKIERIDTWEAFNMGAEFGQGIDDALSGFSPDDLFNVEGIPSADDYADLYGGVCNIDDNTADIADSLSVTDEELKYLRDIAERETINRFTTAEITIEQTNNNNISSDTDLDGVVNGITDAVTEAVFIVTEGVHT